MTPHVLFYGQVTGKLAIGHVTAAGVFVQTQSSDASVNWTHVVATNAGAHVLFYHSANGDLFIGHIDQAGHLAATQSSKAAVGWTHIVVVGDYVLFYRAADGQLFTGTVDAAGHLVRADVGATIPGWSLVFAVDHVVLCYRRESGELFAIPVNQSNGHLGPVQSGGPGASYTFSTVVGDHVVLYNEVNGQLFIGHLDETGNLTQTQFSGASAGWWQIEPSGGRGIVLANAKGDFVLGDISPTGTFVQSPHSTHFVIPPQIVRRVLTEGSPGSFGLPSALVLYEPGGELFIGGVVAGAWHQTQASRAGQGWTHIVSVAP